MATVNAVVEMLGGSSVRVTWPSMLNGDVGSAVTFGELADRSFQVAGTFGTGGSVAIKGSNDNTNFVDLSDLRGVAFAINTSRIEQIEDSTYAIRPQVTAGDGTTNLTVTMFARRGN